MPCGAAGLQNYPMCDVSLAHPTVQVCMHRRWKTLVSTGISFNLKTAWACKRRRCLTICKPICLIGIQMNKRVRITSKQKRQSALRSGMGWWWVRVWKRREWSWVIKVQQTVERSTELRVLSQEFLFNHTQIILFLKIQRFGKYSHLTFMYIIGYNIRSHEHWRI